jgi:ATP-binding cassette subfamily B protein
MIKTTIKKFKFLISGYILIGILTALIGAFEIFLFQKLLDIINISDNVMSAILPALVLYSACAIANCIINYFDNYPYQKLSLGIYYNIKLQVLKKLDKIQYLSYLKEGTGKLVQIVESGSLAAKNILFDYYINILRNLLPGMLVSLIFLGFYNIRITAIVGIGYVIIFVITNIMLKVMYKLKDKILSDNEWMSRRFIRALMEFAVFRLNKKYKKEHDVMELKSEEIISAETKILMIHEFFFAFFYLLIIFVKIMIIVLSVTISKESVGTIVAMTTLVGNIYNPIAIFNVMYVQYKLNKVTYSRLKNFMDSPDEKNLNIGMPINISNGDINFNDVSFSYNDIQILMNLNINIPAKKMCAIVGSSGSGKSTIAKLIIGFLKPVSGSIQVDGNEIDEIKLNDYYEQLMYISQESPVFDGTLRENIVFDKEVSDQNIYEVLNLLCLNDMVNNMEKGLLTEIGEKGIMLSGGERQRVALARLFFDDSKIIILDEATSALDYKTEEIVMDNVLKKTNRKTLIVIAHRLKTISIADNIIVLESGEVIENGNFNELIKKQGKFYELWNKQSEIEKA